MYSGFGRSPLPFAWPIARPFAWSLRAPPVSEKNGGIAGRGGRVSSGDVAKWLPGTFASASCTWAKTAAMGEGGWLLVASETPPGAECEGDEADVVVSRGLPALLVALAQHTLPRECPGQRTGSDCVRDREQR